MSENPAHPRSQGTLAGVRQAAAAVLGFFTMPRLPACSGCHQPDWDCSCMSLTALAQQPGRTSGAETKENHHV